MTGREIRIDPVTRIEGHAKITIALDDAGEVTDAHFHVTQFRGFETLCQGRPLHEMPSLMARICGICPVSHLVASAKACDDILAVDPPPAAVALRRVLNLAQLVQSADLTVGSDYLVSATGGNVTGCGFTGPASGKLQKLYDRAFG